MSTKVYPIVDAVPVATSEMPGMVIPDGTTITVESDGTIHGAEVAVATTSSVGVVKPDGATITVSADGTISGASTYTLPTATSSTLGGVRVSSGNGLNYSSGLMYLNVASTSDYGTVKIDGNTIYMNSSDQICVNFDNMHNSMNYLYEMITELQQQVETLQYRLDALSGDATVDFTDGTLSLSGVDLNNGTLSINASNVSLSDGTLSMGGSSASVTDGTMNTSGDLTDGTLSISGDLTDGTLSIG